MIKDIIKLSRSLENRGILFKELMNYEHFNNFRRKTASDKVLIDKTFNIAKNPKPDGYQQGLASMIYNCFNTSNVILLIPLLIVLYTFTVRNPSSAG